MNRAVIDIVLLEFSLPLAVVDLRGDVRDACPPGGPNSFDFMQLWENLAKSYVSAPPGVGAPSGKSWIRHCLVYKDDANHRY